MLMIFTNDSTSCEIFDGPLISSFLHKHELFSIPFIKIGGFDERVHDSVLPMFASTVNTKMNPKMDGCPGWIFLFTVNTYLKCISIKYTLFLLIFFNSLNTVSLTSSLTVYSITIFVLLPYWLMLSSFFFIYMFLFNMTVY